MGTRGFVVIKYHNKYYKIYHQYDSYPSHLGKKVINIILRLKEGNRLTQNVDCVHEIIDCFNDDVKVEDNDQDLDLFIEWVYTIDLDEMTIEIKGGDKYVPEYDIFNVDYEWLRQFKD
jgi:hypothetical protein